MNGDFFLKSTDGAAGRSDTGRVIYRSVSLRDLVMLMKVPLCLYIAASAVVGYLMAGGSCFLCLLGTVLGVFFLACGSAVLNNIQDRHFDACFDRTAKRALVTGAIRPKEANILSFFLMSGGLGLLFYTTGMATAVLGVLAVLFYNGLYTPLKKKSLLAMFPGVATGMVVPLMGWIAGNGTVNDPVLFNLCVVLGVWQIPHFLVLKLRYEIPVDTDTAPGRFPDIFCRFSVLEVKLLVLLWTALYALCIWHLMIIFPLHPLWMGAVAGNACLTFLLLFIALSRLFKMPRPFPAAIINASMGGFMGTIFMDALIRMV